jgi:DNA repair protein RadC
VEYPSPLLKSLPLRERPAARVRERPDACGMVELIAAVVGGSRQLEIAGDVVRRFETLEGLLWAAPEEMESIPHLGWAGAARLKAALELGRRMVVEKADRRAVIRSPADAAGRLVARMVGLDQEELWVLLLDTRNQVITEVALYKGDVNTAHVRPCEVFKEAIRRNAAAVIIAHNHVSGDASPSPEDLSVTKTICAAGDLLGIEVLDHLVIGKERYVSMKERGLGFQ